MRQRKDFDFTPDEMFANLNRLTWWFENMFRIQPLRAASDDDLSAHELVPFELNWTQREIMRHWLMHPRLFVLKARQLGVTTLALFYFLYLCMTRPNMNLFVWNLNDKKRAKMLMRLKKSLECLPPHLKKIFDISTSNETEITIRSICGGYSTLYVDVSPRSDTVSGAEWSEAGPLSDRSPGEAAEVLSAISGCCPPPNPFLVDSTAYSRRGPFYDNWLKSITRLNEGQPLTDRMFYPLFIPWWRKPENEIDIRTIDKSWHLSVEMAEYFEMLQQRDQIILRPGQRAWYESEHLTQGKRVMRRENPSTWEEAFEAAADGAFMIEGIERARVENRIGKFPPIPGVPVSVYVDIGWNNYTALLFYQEIDGQARIVDAYRNRKKQPAHYVRRVREFVERHSTRTAEIDLPHDAASSRTGMEHTLLQQWRQLYTEGAVHSRIARPRIKLDGTHQAQTFCNYALFNDCPGVQVLIDCLMGVSYKFNKVRNVYDQQGALAESEHNDSYDSFELCALANLPRYVPQDVQGQFAGAPRRMG